MITVGRGSFLTDGGGNVVLALIRNVTYEH
jgi:hypothetical protein